MKIISQKGFTLLEVIVAIFITVVGIIGIYSVIGDLSALAQDANQRLVAAYIAEEGLEIVRNIRDNNIRAKEQGACPTDPAQCPAWNRYFLDVKGQPSALALDYKSLLTFAQEDISSKKIVLPSGCIIGTDDCYKAIYESSDFPRLKVNSDGLYSNDGSGQESPFKRITLVSDCLSGNLSSAEISDSKYGASRIIDQNDCMMVDTIVIWKDRRVRAIRATQEMYNYFR